VRGRGGGRSVGHVSTRLRYRVRGEGMARKEGVAGELVPAARRLAGSLLRPLPDRWRHTIGVAARAAELTRTVPSGDREILVAAAWLHDIGYSSSIQDSGFHPLDGALFLRRAGWPERICALVAHHSGARFMASASGREEGLRQFPFERSPVSDALTYADQTVGAHGQRLDVEDRMADAVRRHGPDSVQARVYNVRAPYVRAAADRVRTRGEVRRG
jgi:putative nucleotidyltransferase with HDIG domain